MSRAGIDSKEVNILFNNLIDRSEDIPLDDIGRMMVSSVKANFRADGRPDKWPDRSDSTRSWNTRLSPQYAAFGAIRDQQGKFKRNLKGDWPLLRKTGRMYASIDYAAYEIPGGYEITIGDDTSYGKYHNTGTKKMPKRQFLLFQNDDIKEIESIIARIL